MADSKQYERVGREAVVDFARKSLGEFRQEYFNAVKAIDSGSEPTAAELADVRAEEGFGVPVIKEAALDADDPGEE